MKKQKEITLPLPFEYNTGREHILLKEYGRIMQKMATHIVTIPERPKRTQAANSLLSLVKLLHPSIKETTENNQRLWDHLFVLTDMNLDVDCPFEIQQERIQDRKPQRLEPNKKMLKYKHYGRNLETLVVHACSLTDRMEQLSVLSYIGRLMKTFYVSWGREGIDDETVIEHIIDISNNQIELDIDTVKQYNMFSTLGQPVSNDQFNNTQRSLNPNHHKTHQNRSFKKGGGHSQSSHNSSIPPRHKKKSFGGHSKKRG
ncbi:MAG: DUF4290 domain-containing protein [Cytophagales bacterium]|nr:MAG: DUF4290 domain-containing protein [Cytophagales bacterium]TAF62319.1 MAG: DUF4290 domain-containing protein [Cytophagales bacterium]